MRGVQVFLAVLLMVTLPAAAPPSAADIPAGKAGDASPAIGDPKLFRIERSGIFNGRPVDYTVLAGETRLTNGKDQETAGIFSIAYVRRDVKSPATRPVTFLFNGGPGSASLWLHLGIFGPRRVEVPDNAVSPGAPPYPLVDNPLSILDVTDLVFIDPVGTGYSRVVGRGNEKDFFGVKEDAASIAQFIRRWLTDNKRWASPKYLGGESYGGIRIGALLPELSQSQAAVALNGLLLISPAIDVRALDFVRGNDNPYWEFLPSYAATAWYHGKVADMSGGFEAFLEAARHFALEEYAPALLKGNRLSTEERRALAAKLARFTGLSADYIERSNLRVPAARFMKELLRDNGRIIGRIDSRYTGEDYDEAGERPDTDPSLNGMSAAYSAAMNHYLLNELGIDMGRGYKVLDPLGRSWNWTVPDAGRGGVNAAPWIGDAMRGNPGLRAFVAAGYYDLATPFFAMENGLSGHGIPPDRVSFAHYPAGHMMYVHKPSLEKLADDVRRFIAAGARP